MVKARDRLKSTVIVACGVLYKKTSQVCGHGIAMLACDTKLGSSYGKMTNTIKSWPLLNTQCLLKTQFPMTKSK